MSTFLNAQNKSESASGAAAPPTAKAIHTENDINGGKLVDDYHWLRDKSNPEVAQYLNAENAYADSVMAPTAALQQKLYDEMVSHIKETDVNVPYKYGGYFYYSRWEKGQQYQIFARKKGSVDAAEEITLNVNELAKGQPFMSLGAYEMSDDGNLLAYTTDNTGYRQYKLRVRDLRTGKDSEVIADRVGSVTWANDNKTLFYSVEDDKTKRQFQFYQHVLGGEAGKDALVYEEKDERFSVGAAKSRSGKYIFLQITSHTTSEARMLDADNPKGEWKLIAPRQQDVEYYPDHHGDQLLIRTNDKGRTFRLVQAPLIAPGKENWKEVVPTRADVMLNDLEIFADFYVLVERENGLPQLTVVNFANGEKKRIAYTEPVYTSSPQTNREYKTRMFRYAYQSLVTPASVFDYDVEKHASTLLKQTEVPGGYDAAKYQSERVWATAKDGTKIPVSLVYRKDLKKADGSNPLYVYAYGSYGAILPVTFGSTRLSLLDRGVVMAYAHIRGGGDMGKP
ncbi:MAG TPA: oligopeptidase B, partial [Candidatus Angelobacter sp.]|nr:oligopeptidase B [Candidatus Angelobacter sp.]